MKPVTDPGPQEGPGNPPRGPSPKPCGSTVNKNIWRPLVAELRSSRHSLFNDPYFTGTLLISSGATLFLGCTWLYRYVTHDPHLDLSSGLVIPFLVLLIAAIVFIRVTAIREEKNHGW